MFFMSSYPFFPPVVKKIAPPPPTSQTQKFGKKTSVIILPLSKNSNFPKNFDRSPQREKQIITSETTLPNDNPSIIDNLMQLNE